MVGQTGSVDDYMSPFAKVQTVNSLLKSCESELQESFKRNTYPEIRGKIENF